MFFVARILILVLTTLALTNCATSGSNSTNTDLPRNDQMQQLQDDNQAKLRNAVTF